MPLVVTHLQHHTGEEWIVPEGGDGVVDKKLLRGHAKVAFQADDVIGIDEHVCITAPFGEAADGLVTGKPESVVAQQGSLGL